MTAMEFETIRILNDCLALLDELNRQSTEEKDNICICLGGLPLTAYLQNVEKAEQEMQRLKQSILLLQAELAAGMQ